MGAKEHKTHSRVKRDGTREVVRSEATRKLLIGVGCVCAVCDLDGRPARETSGATES